MAIRSNKSKGYIYYNVVNGKLLDRQHEEHVITEYQDKSAGKKRIIAMVGEGHKCE